jgi:hypothetical protein
VFLAVCYHSTVLALSVSFLRLSLLRQSPLVRDGKSTTCLTRTANSYVIHVEAQQSFQLRQYQQRKLERVLLAINQLNAFSDALRVTFSGFTPTKEVFSNIQSASSSLSQAQTLQLSF